MLGNKLFYETGGVSRKVPASHDGCGYVENPFVLIVTWRGCEVIVLVLDVIHFDDDAVEARNNWHGFLTT